MLHSALMHVQTVFFKNYCQSQTYLKRRQNKHKHVCVHQQLLLGKS